MDASPPDRMQPEGDEIGLDPPPSITLYPLLGHITHSPKEQQLRRSKIAHSLVGPKQYKATIPPTK